MPPPAHRDFDIDRPEHRKEGPSFSIAGETFQCVPEAPGGAVSALISGIDYDANGNEVFHATNVNRFIELVLQEERVIERETPRPDGEEGPPVVTLEPEETDDLKRWRMLMQDKSRPVALPELVDIVVWLQEWYTSGRPTVRSRR